MKYLVLFTLTLFGCATIAQTHSKPSGEKVISSLLEVSDRILSNEPLCNMESISSPSNPYTLKHHLSVILATSYESENITNIQTSCAASKHEQSGGKIIDIWDCTLATNENSSSGEFISASTIAFGLNKRDLAFVPQSLRCF